MNLEEDILIERYLKDQLTPVEKEAFEKKLNAEKSFREKVEFEKQLSETLNDNDWSFIKNPDSIEKKEYEQLFKSEETKKIKRTISDSYQDYLTKRARKKRNWLLSSTSIAAAIVLISFYTYFSAVPSANNLYYSYLEDTKPITSLVRGNKDTQKMVTEAEKFFENKNYNKAAALFSKAIENQRDNSAIYIFLAISKMELKNYDEAETILNALIQSNLTDAPKGYWYKSLLYLKSEDLIKCKTTLNYIIKNSYYNNSKAAELLAKLPNQ